MSITKNSDRAARLRDLAAQLNSFVENRDAVSDIVPGNGYDESMLLGSPDSFLLLAKTLVEIVADSYEPSAWTEDEMWIADLEGVSVATTNRIKFPFDEFSPVWVMCAYLASDDDAVREIMKKIG